MFLDPVLLSAQQNSKSSRVLVLLVVPGHLLFLYTIHLLQGGHSAVTLTFMSRNLSAVLLQVRSITRSSPLAGARSESHSHCLGGGLALRSQCDGTVAVGEGPRPGSLLHSRPHGSEGPAGNRPPGSELQTQSTFLWWYSRNHSNVAC